MNNMSKCQANIQEAVSVTNFSKKTKLTVQQQTALRKGNFCVAPKQISVVNFAIAVVAIAQRPQPVMMKNTNVKAPQLTR